MKRDLITKHPQLPESKHMLYCTYTPHLLYSQAHIILMHTESHLLHSATHLTKFTLHTDCVLEVEDSHCTAAICFGHSPWKVHVCYNMYSSSGATHLVTEMQEDINYLFVACLWPDSKRIRVDSSS